MTVDLQPSACVTRVAFPLLIAFLPGVCQGGDMSSNGQFTFLRSRQVLSAALGSAGGGDAREEVHIPTTAPSRGGWSGKV